MSSTFTIHDVRRILPAMISDESDPEQAERLRYALAHFECEDRLWKSGMSWEDAKAEALRRYPPLYDTEGSFVGIPTKVEALRNLGSCRGFSGGVL